jgi:hypothetical protein
MVGVSQSLAGVSEPGVKRLLNNSFSFKDRPNRADYSIQQAKS